MRVIESNLVVLVETVFFPLLEKITFYVFCNIAKLKGVGCNVLNMVCFKIWHRTALN